MKNDLYAIKVKCPPKSFLLSFESCSFKETILLIKKFTTLSKSEKALNKDMFAIKWSDQKSEKLG